MKTGYANKADQSLVFVSSFESCHAHEGEDAGLDICSLRAKRGISRVESMGSLFLLPGTGQGDLGSSEEAQESAEAVEKGCNESDLIAPGDKCEMVPPPNDGAEVEDASQHGQSGCEGDDEDVVMVEERGTPTDLLAHPTTPPLTSTAYLAAVEKDLEGQDSALGGPGEAAQPGGQSPNDEDRKKRAAQRRAAFVHQARKESGVGASVETVQLGPGRHSPAGVTPRAVGEHDVVKAVGEHDVVGSILQSRTSTENGRSSDRRDGGLNIEGLGQAQRQIIPLEAAPLSSATSVAVPHFSVLPAAQVFTKTQVPTRTQAANASHACAMGASEMRQKSLYNREGRVSDEARDRATALDIQRRARQRILERQRLEEQDRERQISKEYDVDNGFVRADRRPRSDEGGLKASEDRQASLPASPLSSMQLPPISLSALVPSLSSPAERQSEEVVASRASGGVASALAKAQGPAPNNGSNGSFASTARAKDERSQGWGAGALGALGALGEAWLPSRQGAAGVRLMKGALHDEPSETSSVGSC